MNVRFWGVRGSVPTPQADRLYYGGNTMCLQVGDDDAAEPVVIDCGTGARALGQQLGHRSASLRIHLLLTHFHWDHIQGMPYFAPLFEADSEIVIYTDRPAEEARRLLTLQMSRPFFPLPLDQTPARIEFRTVAAGETFGAGGLSVGCVALHHPQGAVGFRVERNGAVLLHACDHEYGNPEVDAGLRRAAGNASVLVIDAQYTPGEYASRKGWGHSSYAHAAELAEAAGVDQLVLIHHDPAHDDAFLTRMEAGAQAMFARTRMAREGDVLPIALAKS